MSAPEPLRARPEVVGSPASTSLLEGLALAERIAAIASDRKAIDIRIVDLRGLVAYTDTLVVCSGNTERQTKAVHDAIHRELKDEHGLLPRRVEGEREARWILMDYLDCVAHLFTPEARSFYRIDQLWGDAPARVVE
ncbi:MAG: ribosome silencing factor [Thermoleophilaceae bacterium]